MARRLFLACWFLAATTVLAAEQPVEIRQRLATGAEDSSPTVALTLDACGGAFDAALVHWLIDHRIPATIFATRRWIDRNPVGVALLRDHPELFEIEDHGANHVPAVIGANRRVYGIPGATDAAALKQEIIGGAEAIERAWGIKPRWYRGATAMYDPAVIGEIERLGYRIAGFSLNADDGASLPRSGIVARLKTARSGDIIIAHMNHPTSDTASGLAIGIPWLQAHGFRFVKLGEARLEPLLPPATIARNASRPKRG